MSGILEQMRTKGFVLLLCCIIATGFIFCFFGDPKPSLHEFVSETQRHFSKLKNFKKVNPVPDAPSPPQEPRPEEKYLKILGFNRNPRLFPNQTWQNVTLPVIITAVRNDQAKHALGFMKSVAEHLPDHFLLIYDLGLGDSEAANLNKYCNSSSCTVWKFDFDLYPSHVNDPALYAHRPIIIQEVLDKTGAVIWMDVRNYIVSGSLDDVMQQAQKHGLVSWTINQPTSALTHPRMFEYFHTQRENYYFHRMVEPSHIVLYNTAHVHRKLMLPWVQCALNPDCIAPIGAQSTGCRFDKKPFYRYTGCHRYDASALNVILGMMFNYEVNSYTAPTPQKFFQMVEEEETTTGPNKHNVTAPLSREMPVHA